MAIHVYPLDDWFDHDTESMDCLCEPRVEFVDPETGEPHPEPLVIHNALDQREVDK